MTRKLFLCWGIIIALLLSSLPPVFAANDSAGLIEEVAVVNATSSNLVLVENGEPRSTIILSQSATEHEKKAAQELKDYIRQISGAELPVAEEADGVQGTKLFIGSAAPNPDKEAILIGGDEPDSFRLHVAEGAIQMVGLDDSDKGSLYAAYELLEQIGVRWFMPGDIGTVVPTMSTIAVGYQDTIQHAGFAFRFLQATSPYVAGAGLPVGVNLTEAAPWVEHVRLNQKTLGAHGLLITSPTNKERPDLFLPDAKGNPTGQYDVTKPEVLELVVAEAIKRLEADPKLEYLRMGPNDGSVIVLKPDPEWDGNDMGAIHGGTLSLTDRYVKFFNLVLERLDAAGYKDVKISFYAYDEYYYPPVKHMPDPRIVPIIASIRTDRMKSIENPISWERQHVKDVIDGWKKVSPNVMIYDYLYNLADPGLPFSLAERVGTEYKYFKDQGIIGIRGEALPAWGYHGPALYLAAKMMWNPDLDVKALLEDYFIKLYGPAAAPMKKHFEILENAFANADYYAGSINDFQHILNANVMQEMEQSLKEAEDMAQGASDPVYAKRVNMVRIAYSFGDNFLEMKELLNSFKFIEAKEKFDQISKIREEAVTNSPVILNTLASYNYTDWFFEKITNQGSQRLSNGNRMVAELPDEWDVMLFPNAFGNKLGLWKPGLGTDSWMKLKTYSESWSDQGIGYYKGHAWYRTMVDVDQNFNTGNPIRLWFSSIDETARVWLNGQELTLLQKGNAMMKPWEFDATPAIKFGEPNLIVVDVGNEVLDELGTGGIVGPAMLWEVVTELDATPPTAPENLTVEQISGSEVRVSWSPSTDNSGVAGYILEVLNPPEIGGILGTVKTDSTTYIHTGLKTDMVRRYRVKAMDYAGNVSGFKDVKLIKMQPLPDITTQPQSQTVAEGQTAVFTVAATGTEPLSYQWKKDGEDIPGANSVELRIENVKASDAGRYSIVITDANKFMATSLEAILTVDAIACTITYDANGGSGNMEGSTVTSGAAITLPTNRFTAPEGKMFIEWAIGSADGDRVDAGGTYTFAGNTTVYAIWGDIPENSYKMTIQTEGSGMAFANTEYATEGTEITLTATPDGGYQFKEWQVISGGVTITDSKFNMPAGEVTVKAVFEAEAQETYTVTFNSNGGSYVAAITDVTSGSAITAPMLPTREGYTFAGWYKDEELENAWNFVTGIVTSDITLYAKWTKNTEEPGTYTVTFDVDGVKTNLTVTTGGAIQLPPAPAKAGYTFKGWYDTATGGTEVTVFNATMTVYAQWTQNTTPTPTPTPTPSPVPETKVEEGRVTTTISTKPTTDADGRATAAISETQLADAIARAEGEAAKQDKKTEITVKIEVSAPVDAMAAGVDLTAEALKKFAESKADILVISTPFGTMSFDDKAAAGIFKQSAGTITITAAKVEAAELTEEIRQKVGDRPVVSFDITGKDKTISQLGGKAEVTIPYVLKEGENPKAIVAYYINSAGKLEAVKNCKYDPVTGTITFKTPHFSKYAVGYNKVDFTDVADSAWYHDAVTFAAAREITLGVGKGNFGSDEPVTRAQALVMIMKAFGVSPDENAESNFIDAGNSYYTGYLAAAKNLGITSGVGDNKFVPDRQVTRQELFVLIYNTLKNMNELPTANTAKDLEDFKDVGKVADYANSAIELFVKAGIISGSNGNILPEDSASRAQFVQILYNIMTK